jgi:hypothetical protein
MSKLNYPKTLASAVRRAFKARATFYKFAVRYYRSHPRANPYISKNKMAIEYRRLFDISDTATGTVGHFYLSGVEKARK